MSSFAEIPIARRKDLCPLFAKHKHVRPSADAVLRGHSGQPANRPTPRVADRPTGRPPDRPTGRPADWPTARLADRPTDWPTRRLADRLTGRPPDWPTGRLADWPTGRPATRRTGELANRRTGEPANWRTARLADWLTGRLADPHHIHSSTASLGFRAWSGTVASGAGYPTGKRTSGRSLSGLSRMLERNAMGAAV